MPSWFNFSLHVVHDTGHIFYRGSFTHGGGGGGVEGFINAKLVQF